MAKRKLDESTLLFLGFMYIPLLLIIIMTAALTFSGHVGAAGYVSMLGTPLVLGVALVYITFFHSKKRWPELSARQRFINVMTFTR